MVHGRFIAGPPKQNFNRVLRLLQKCEHVPEVNDASSWFNPVSCNHTDTHGEGQKNKAEARACGPEELVRAEGPAGPEEPVGAERFEGTEKRLWA